MTFYLCRSSFVFATVKSDGLVPPATKLRQGNVFTPVCHSAHREVSVGRGVFIRRVTCGGTYPTGMHSCVKVYSQLAKSNTKANFFTLIFVAVQCEH